MVCLNCNNEIPDDCAFCPRCGAALASSSSTQPPIAIPPPDKASGMAITAMVIGIIGAVSPMIGIVLGPIAIILSIKENKKFKSGLSNQLSKTFALVGLILGIIAAALGLIILLFFAAMVVPDLFSTRNQSKVARTKGELRSCATALESYYVDNNAYPRPDYDVQHNPILPHILTTPVAYMANIPCDTYSPDGKQQYHYYTGLVESEDTTKPYWIITSRGPDLKTDIEVTRYNPQYAYWGKNYIIPKSYDPTNGTTSQGDIWRTGPE